MAQEDNRGIENASCHTDGETPLALTAEQAAATTTTTTRKNKTRSPALATAWNHTWGPRLSNAGQPEGNLALGASTFRRLPQPQIGVQLCTYSLFQHPASSSLYLVSVRRRRRLPSLGQLLTARDRFVLPHDAFSVCDLGG